MKWIGARGHEKGDRLTCCQWSISVMSKELYLSENVLAEPLMNQWYAWSHLIPPATASMFMANQHLKIMQSFIAAPQVHISALKNPSMKGGPFINYGADRVDDIKSLLDKTRSEQGHMLELAEAIKKLDDMLMKEASGYSLEPLYQNVPDILKGYVELVYDLNNQPSVRFIEGLLYKSRYHNPAGQSYALSVINSDDRHFAFSSPRLKDDGTLQLDIPFNDEGLDEL